MSGIKLEDIINKIKDLPPLPQSVHLIMKITNDPNSTANDLADAVEKDPSLTAKVLKLANSSYYGFAREISTISHAVVCLGFNTVKSIALTASTHKILSQEIPAYDMGKGSLWSHAITTGTACRFIAKRVGYKDLEEAYIAGLLHDIGKIMLSRYASDQFKIILTEVQDGDIPFDVAELDVLGFDHPLIGSKVAEKWNLHPDLVEAIALHHRPEESKRNPELTKIVHISDTISYMIGIGMGNDAMKYIFQSQALVDLKLNELDIERAILEVTEKIEEIDKIYK